MQQKLHKNMYILFFASLVLKNKISLFMGPFFHLLLWTANSLKHVQVPLRLYFLFPARIPRFHCLRKHIY